MDRVLQRAEIGANDGDKETILGIQYDEKRIKLLNKCMSELTSFAASVQPGLMPNRK
jgi:hypothetical protein